MATTLLLLILAVVAGGCGSSQAGSRGRSSTPSSGVAAMQMAGIWGGYFPGSSLENPENGIELHFDRPVRDDGALHAAGFIHRDGFAGSRHHIDIVQQEASLTLTFDAGTGDESVFEGTFIDQWTVRGTYTNPSRDEVFEVDLRHSDSVPLERLEPVSLLNSALAAQPAYPSSPESLVLHLDFTTTSDTIATTSGPLTVEHSMDFGYGQYLAQYPDEAHWEDNTRLPLGFADRTTPYAVDWYRGTSTIRTMVFYPDWVLLELFPPAYANGSNTFIDGIAYQVASLEIPWSSLIDLDGSKLASGSWAAQTFDDNAGGSWDYFVVENLRLSYRASSHDIDADDFAVTVDEPGNRNLILDGSVYSVPGNTIEVLRYLGFSIPYHE